MITMIFSPGDWGFKGPDVKALQIFCAFLPLNVNTWTHSNYLRRSNKPR